MDAEPQVKSAEVIRATDPRDYIKITHFQKAAAELDPDKAHPWGKVPNGIWLKDDKGTIALGLAHSKETNKWSLLITEKQEGFTGSSENIESTDRQRLETVGSWINQFGQKVDTTTRHIYARWMIDLLKESQDKTPDDVNKACIGLALNLLSDINNDDLVEVPQFNYQKENPTPQQAQELDKFFKLLYKKTPKGTFEDFIRELQEDIPQQPDALSKTYIYFFFENGARQTLNSKTNLKDLETKPDGRKKFPAHELITKPIVDSELVKSLEDMHVEPAPETSQINLAEEKKAEMVDLDKIVGGTNIKTWTVSTTGDRGPEHILKIAKGIANQSIDVSGNNGNYPIDLIKYNDKYYVNGDGRHRVAALKALGVPFAPMLVTQATSK